MADLKPFTGKLDEPQELKPFTGVLDGQKSGALRTGIADKALGFASGAVGATKAIADAAGAGNAVSGALDSINTGISDYLSPEAKADQQAQGAIMDQAKGKGVWEGVKAGAQAFSVAPVQTAVQGLGSIVPILAGTALTGGAAPAAAVGAGIGMAMGAGTAKGAIFDDIKKRSLAGGMSEVDATAAATKAQEYSGDNTDQIALGGALGAADALTGVSRIAGGMARGALRKPVADALVNTSERGIVGRTAMGMAGEMPLEAAQGGQEQLATNLAAQRAGYQAGTWDNVASNATLEALASAGPGAAFGALERGHVPTSTATAPAEKSGPVAPALQFGNTPDPLLGFPDGTVARRSEIDAHIASLPPDQQPAARAKAMGLAPQPAAPQAAPSAVTGIPVTPSAAMGLNPTAGPLSAAAVTAVDTGAHQTHLDQQASEADQAAYDAHMAEQDQQAAQQDTTNQPITHGPIAEAAMSAEDKQAILFSNKVVADGGHQWTGTQDGDILNGLGKPYPTRFAAQRRARMEGAGWTIAPVFDGFVARRSESKADAEPSASNGPAAGVTGNITTQAKLENQSNHALTPVDTAQQATENAVKHAGTDVVPGGMFLQVAGNNYAVDSFEQASDMRFQARKELERQGGGRIEDAPIMDGSGRVLGYVGMGDSVYATKDAGALAPKLFDAAKAAVNSVPSAPAQSALIGVTPPVTQPAQPVMGEGAGGSRPTQAEPTKPKTASKDDLDHLFGMDQKRAKAIERIAKGTAYFSNGIKAQQFISQNGLKDTHTVQRHAIGENRYDVVVKTAVQPVSQPQGSTNGTTPTQAVETKEKGPQAPSVGDQVAPEFIKIKDIDGMNRYVKQSDLDGDKPLIRMFTKDGHNNGRIHRDNLDPTGEKQAEDISANANNPFFDVITNKEGGAFATVVAARRALNRRGLQGTHIVAKASDVSAGATGFVVRKKALQSPAEVDANPATAQVSPKRGIVAKIMQARQARADYFTPGNIVKGYAGYDKVLSYHPGGDGNGWNVKVRAVVKQDGKWAPDPKDSRERSHSTPPGARELNAGPVERVKQAPDVAQVIKPTVPAAPAAPAKKPAGANNLRKAAYEKNPLLTFLATHGLYHDKGNTNSQKSEFSPDKHIMVSGYGGIFRKTGQQPSDLVPQAIQDGYLPKNGTVDMLTGLIQRAISGEKIKPMYAEGVAESHMDELISQREQQYNDLYASELDKVQAGDFDPFESVSELGFTLDDAEVAGYDAAQDPIKLEVNALLAQAGALGIDTDTLTETAYEDTRNGSEQDYQEAARDALKSAIAASSGNSSQDAGSTGDAGSQEGLTAPTQADVLAQQDRAASADRAEKAQRKAQDLIDKKDRERKDIAKASEAAADSFVLGGDAEQNLSGQKSVFDASSQAETPFTYINGDRAEYTGKTETIHGGLFHEVKFTEGTKKGETGVTQRAPDGTGMPDNAPKSTGIVTPQIVPTKLAANDRDNFTLERLNSETGKMEPVTFTRGEYVRHKLGFGEIDGISQARSEFSVDGLWYPFGFAYKADKPEAVKPPTVALSKVIDAVNAKNGQGLTEADAVPNPATILDSETSLWSRITDGKATVDEFKAGFENWVKNKGAILEALSKNKKDDLLKMGGSMFAYRNKSENKAAIVEALWRDGANQYVLARSFSHGMGKNAWIDGVRNIVDNTDAEQLAQYATDRKAAQEEAVARVGKIAEAIKDPKTLDDFKTWMRATMSTGKTFKEARLELAPAQRAQYDDLTATESRDARASRKDAKQDAILRAPGEAVTASEIIQTKHTKHGHDLWQLNLDQRVSGDEFKSLVTQAKRLGGDYSSYRGNGAIPGWQFRTEDAAKAFKALIAGDTTAAQGVMQERRDAFADDRSQSASERLNEMADRLDERADASLGQERKANTHKRASQAASAEAAANAEKAMAKTMRNIAQAITDGKAKFLDRVRQKVQVSFLQTALNTAHYDELRAKGLDIEKHRGEAPTAEAADFAEFPTFTAYRSDLATLARQLLEVDGTKLLGQRLLKEADDVSDAYLKFAQENFSKVSAFKSTDGGVASFGTKADAEASIARSGYKGKAVAYQVKRGQHAVILSPSEAIERGIWQGDGDKRISLSGEFGAEMVEKIGKAARRGAKVSVPWQMETAHDRRQVLQRMGIETPAEFRAALREFVALQEQAEAPSKVKELERAMVGRRNDGMDFFPTPEGVADEMVAAAGIEPGMSVLEPSAGWGHIAERIQTAGVDPDVGEMSNDRRELLEAKGFNVVSRDFMDMSPRGFTYGDLFRAPDGTVGVMRGSGGLGSSQVGLDPLDANRQPDMRISQWHDRDSLVGIEKRGGSSGYDRIIMNPPFSDGRDIQHVQHAFTLLKPGGRIVAIMGESAFTNQNKRATEFRAWLESVGGTEEKLAEGSFNDPSLPVNTGANARMVVIDKTKETDQGVAMFSRSPFNTPSTVSKVQKAIRQLTGITGRNQLGRTVATTAAEIKSTWEPLTSQSVNIESEGDTGKAQGYFDPKSNTVFLITDHIRAGDEMAVLAHELMHKHGKPVLGKDGWDRLHGVISTWEHAEFGSKEYAVYHYASSKVEAIGVSLSNQELFPYAIEAAMKIGIKPNAMARQGTVQKWLASVIQSMKSVWEKVIGKPDAFKVQDLVNLAFGIAQMENPAHADTLRGALRGTNDAVTNNDVVGNQGGRSADDSTPGAAKQSFREWFKGSMVVDDTEKPLVVYHGTSSRSERASIPASKEKLKFSADMQAKYGDLWSTKLNQSERSEFLSFPPPFGLVHIGADLEGGEFDPSRTSDIGIHFGTVGQAGEFGENGAVYPVYLDAKNIVRIPDIFSRGGEYVGAVDQLSMAGAIKSAKYDSLISKAKALEKLYESLSDYRDIGTHPKNIAFWKELRASLSLDVDGFVYSNDIEGKGDSYVVFKPDQIRSAIGVNPNEPTAPESGGASGIRGGDTDPAEAAKVQAGIEGKSLIDAARFIEQAGSPAQAEIAKQVISKLERLQASGVKLQLIISHRGDSVPAQMGKSRGYTETGFDAKGLDITVWVSGTDVTGRVGTDFETVLHEMVHAATMGVVNYGKNNPNSLAGKHVRDLSDVTSAISSHIIERFDQSDRGKIELTEFEKDMRAGANNAFRGIDEVLTWALTNPNAQAYLDAIPYKNQNLWTKLVQSIRTLLGLSPTDDTALSEVLRVAENMMASDLNDHAIQAFWHKRTIRMNTIQAENSIILKPTNSYNTDATAPDSGGAMFSRSLGDTLNAAANERKTNIVGETSRKYTAAQLAAFKAVGFQVELPSLKERAQAIWQDTGKKLAQGLVDQFAPIKDISKEAYSLLRLSKGASGAFEVFLNGGQLKLEDGVYNFDDTKRGGVVDRLLKPLQTEHHDFFRWVAANRAERLKGEGKENLFSDADIASLKTLADGTTNFDYTIQNGVRKGQVTRDRTAIYRDSLATFNEFQNNILDMAEQSGLIDGEARKLWEHEFYVPFYRVEDDGSVAGAHIKNGAVRQQAFKSLTGRVNKLNADLMDNTLMNWAHLLDAAAKNRAAKATIEAIEKMGAAIPLEGSAGKGSVWFRENGQKRWALIDDPMLLTAVSALEYTGMRSPVMNAMGSMKRALTIGVTASPFFKVRNLIRDSVQAIGTGNLSYNVAGNLAKGWKLTDPKSDAYFRLMAGGGTIHFGTMMEGSESKRVQALVESGVDAGTILGDDHKVKAFYRKFIEPGITAYNELGNRGEAINRASLYDQLVKQGMSHADASLQARDLMDFSMQGSFTTIRFLTQVVPFFNARIQGLYKLGRAAKEDPARFSAVLGATALFSLALLAAYGDDDDWKKREDWDRNNYWWFKFGGTAFRIPKPFEIGAIATLAERGFELAFDKEMTSTRFRGQVLTLLGDNLSMNPVPQMVKPILDVYANKDSFSGRPIETMGMDRLQPEYRFTDRTSMAARGMSTAANAVTNLAGIDSPSPVQIDSMLRGYFGWLGSFVVGAGDVLARPATGQAEHAAPDYWKTATGSIVSDLRDAPSRYVSQMYTQAKEIEQAYGTWRALQKEGKTQEAAEFLQDNADKLSKYRQIEHIKKLESSANQRIRLIERSSMDGDKKRELIRDVQSQKDRMVRGLAA